MASAFGHAAIALSGSTILSTKNKRLLVLLGVICSILPDIDVLTFRFGIPYSHMYGHRGFTHSVFFAFFISIFFCIWFKKNRIIAFFYLFCCTLSHGILDAMTSGGRGVAFWAPFSAERIFLPWRPIKVSPLGISNFFSSWGLKVVYSELIWIGIPCLIFVLVIFFAKKMFYIK